MKFDVDSLSKWNSLATANLWPTKSDTVASGGIYALTLLGWIFSNLNLSVDAAAGILSKRKMLCNELWFEVEFDSKECSSHPAASHGVAIIHFTFSSDWFCVWKMEADSSYPFNTVGTKNKSATLFGRLDAWKNNSFIARTAALSVDSALGFGKTMVNKS